MRRSQGGQSKSTERNRSEMVVIEAEKALNTYDDPSDFIAQIGLWDIKKYISKIEISIINASEDGMNLEFDLVHVEAPIANALRRVLIAEVPTMAIEKVYLYQNTSVIQDEVLCHRLGLLPIQVDPRLFEMPANTSIDEIPTTDCEEEPAGDPKRNLIFGLKIKCEHNRDAHKFATDPKIIYTNSNVYTEHFEWVPIADQAKWLKPPPTMVHKDILVAKLRPGQEIEASCHCVKGISRDHAKFSPVATATYRLLPVIKLKRNFYGDDATKLKSSFSNGVIEIKNDGAAYVKDARRDTCSRNIFRYEDLAKDVEMGCVKDHFIFSVESTGALKSGDLVVCACNVLENKCASLLKMFESRIKLLKGN